MHIRDGEGVTKEDHDATRISHKLNPRALRSFYAAVTKTDAFLLHYGHHTIVHRPVTSFLFRLKITLRPKPLL